MPRIVRLHLRSDVTDCVPTADGEGAEPRLVLGYPEEVDLDQLTPRARTLAEAIDQAPGKKPVDIWVERDAPIKETVPDWWNWYTEEEAARPERRPWRGWSPFPATSQMTATQWLEREARKIPPGWHVLGYRPDTPVPSLAEGAADRYLTRSQVLDYMRARGRDISVSTWGAYYKRGHAPRPDRYVGRTPQWRVETIDAFLDGSWKKDQELA